MIKWVLGLIGWKLIGFPGILIGYFIGFYIQKYVPVLNVSNEKNNDKQFQNYLLFLSAIVIKSKKGYDITQEQLFVRRFFISQFGLETANRAFKNFNVFKEKYNHISLQKICEEIELKTTYKIRLEIITYLIKLSYTDDKLEISEKRKLEKISEYLNITLNDFYTLLSSFQKRTHYTQSNNYNNKTDYEILGLSNGATNDEIKKAYRILVKKYHPDKVKFLKNITQQEAKIKFQELQQAYERIKKERAF